MAGSVDMIEENKSGIKTCRGESDVLDNWKLAVEASNSRVGSRTVTVVDIFIEWLTSLFEV